MKIERLDHLVLTVADIERSCQFYQQVLGFDIITFRGDRKALRFGQQKINLHRQGHEFEPKAHRPTPGSADLCFITSTPLEQVIEELDDLGVIIEEGPVERTGAIGPLLSLYLRDPDNNLLEIANLLSA
ncbi:VOC family virulence protein [Serratia sp. MYb239]|uniref:VOC family protein n=1 Tax=Serratia sp. MYb239 TaxID=2033438 RepID=UPI000CF5E5CD|nr:VOC family protein [Serratia sp. MYb239]AVJ18918.1 VOC family virulence protein [Serratia sp. MYb239]MBU3891705.1 VOC family protein [Serratia rubidaea]MCA4825324.1 VOC family protein [Serratia rubidaea]SQJ11449.1 Virulence protein STM3117 [Serratia rubidaea]